MKLQTTVSFPPSRIGIRPDDRILVLGSCFADQVGVRMLQAGFQACVNPFGTLYNPFSLASALSRLCDGRPFTESESRLLFAVRATDERLPSARQFSNVMETGSDRSIMFAK